MTKDDYKALILLKQQELPTDYLERKTTLPTDRNKIMATIGVRRCGKSRMMDLAINRLLSAGVPKENILWIGFDDERLAGETSESLNEIIVAYSELFPETPIKDVYMFFDEIQLVEGWELFIMRLFKSYCKHIFISGSNAKMLSSQLHTALRGWPVEVKVQPLDFSEYCSFKGVKTEAYLDRDKARLSNAFTQYIMEGGFPEAVLAKTQSEKSEILQRYFNTMLFRDLIEHYQINTKAEILRYFLKRIMGNLSKPSSINHIFKDIKSQGRSVSNDTLYDWADYSCEIFLFDRIYKYSESMVKETSSMPKYYCVDNGLRNAVVMPLSTDNGKLLENVVFQHIKKTLGGEDKVFYYKENGECDFVVQRKNRVEQLIQVTWSMAGNTQEALSTRKRELDSLIEAARYTKCKNLLLLTADEEGDIEYDGFTVHIKKTYKWMLGQ